VNSKAKKKDRKCSESVEANFNEATAAALAVRGFERFISNYETG